MAGGVLTRALLFAIEGSGMALSETKQQGGYIYGTRFIRSIHSLDWTDR